MFDSLVLHGGEAHIAWGWHTAAVVRRWRIEKLKGKAWALEASIVRADPFTLKQRPLLFTIPRKGGYLVFPITAVMVGVAEVRATLGPPEH